MLKLDSCSFFNILTASPVKKTVDGASSESRAMGMLETLRTVFRDEGVRGLYRGILPNFLKVIPAVSIGYVVYEQIKAVLNVSTVR